MRSLWIAFYLIFNLLMLTPATAMPKLERVIDFSLLDHQGVMHQLRKYGDYKAVVIISTAVNCSAQLDLLPKYRLLQTTWEREGIKFLGINSTGSDSLASIREMAHAHGLELPVLLDEGQLVAESLGIAKVGEIVVVEPQRLRVLYRGGLDGNPRRAEVKHVVAEQASTKGTSVLTDALNAVIARGVSAFDETLETQAAGCELSFPGKDKHLASVPDYGSDVAPLLIEKCVSCHREGGIAPFAMESHVMVQGWAPMIKEVIMTRRMPPAQVDPNIKHFTNAGYLDPGEQQVLVHWIDAGAPSGEIELDPLRQIEPVDSRWDLGEPDYIVQVPAYTVPATGVLDYENVTINLPFEEDLWVKSVQHLPGDSRVLHHLLSFIVPADYNERIVEGENDSYREFLEGYAPGKYGAATYPENTGVFVPKGSAVQMSLHYTTFGKEAVDRTQLGLYFADKQPEYHYSTHAVSQGGRHIEIPPGVDEHKMSASYVFADQVVLHGLRPHMHYRGKYMRFSVIYPNGQREDILNVPDYNFAWQPTYRLSQPMTIPAGSRVLIEGAFDNSQYNLGNPDPGAVVRGGAQSWDEMFIGYLSYQSPVRPQ